MGYSEHDMWNSDENAVQCTTGGLEQGSSCLGIQRSRWWMVLVILCTLDYTFGRWELHCPTQMGMRVWASTRIPSTAGVEPMCGSPNTHSDLDARVARVAS